MIPLVYHPIYSDLPLPKGHRYPINKYRYIYQAVVEQQHHLPSWQTSLQFVKPVPIELSEVMLCHDVEYVQALFDGQLPAAKMRRIGFPWSEQLIKRTLTSAGGTCLTAELAIDHGIAIHLSGGYHHAHADFGSGFCLINDLVIAAKRALQHDNIDKVLIIDADVHHGDGTATMCANEPDIVTVSFHCEKNFPARKPDSDIDIGFARETEDQEYLEHFEAVVQTAMQLHRPDMIIYDAGVDIHCLDELGYFNVSEQGILQRDVIMCRLAHAAKLPMACVVGGGYRENHQDLAPLHLNLISAALQVFQQV